MKAFIKKSNSGISVTDIIFGLVLVAAIYGSYLYIPLVYKSQELEMIAKDYTFKSGGASNEMLKQAVLEDAKRKADITLNEDDVLIIRDGDRTKIQVTWRPVIELPFGFKIPRTFTVEYERKQL